MRNRAWIWGVCVLAGCAFLGIRLLPSPQRVTVSSPEFPASGERRTEELAPPHLRGYSALVLVNEPLIQTEIVLTKEQKERVASLADAFLDDLRPIMDRARGLHELNTEAQSIEWAAMQRDQSALGERFNRDALAALTSAQQRRLGQLALQIRREEAFYEPDVVHELALSQRQLAAIHTARNELRAGAMGVRADYDRQAITRLQLQTKLTTLRTQCLVQYEQLLTGEQALIWSRLRGPVVQFTPDQLRLELRPARRAQPPIATDGGDSR